jgi:hypothetical protein
VTQLGRVGVSVGETVTGEQAREAERLGYGALWVGGSPPAETRPLGQTTTIPHD